MLYIQIHAHTHPHTRIYVNCLNHDKEISPSYVHAVHTQVQMLSVQCMALSRRKAGLHKQTRFHGIGMLTGTTSHTTEHVHGCIDSAT